MTSILHTILYFQPSSPSALHRPLLGRKDWTEHTGAMYIVGCKSTLYKTAFVVKPHQMKKGKGKIIHTHI